MGYGFMIWAVDTDRLQQVAGSRDEKLRRMIGGRFKRDIAQLDNLFSHAIEQGGPSTYEALRQIVDGTVPEGARGGVYAYAFELLVKHFGKPLDNNPVYPWNSPDFGPVDAVLDAMGVPFRFDRLYGCSLPVKLPLPDDFPATGWIDPREAKRIDEAFTKATFPESDPEALHIVKAARGWFRTAASESRGIVSYYY